jgi:hypothetical protein
LVGDGADGEHEIGMVLARMARVDPQLPKADRHGAREARINWYLLTRIETSDPERALDTLEFLTTRVKEAGSLSSIAGAIATCGSWRSSSVLMQLLDAKSPRGVLYAAIDALGDPSNRDAIPKIRAWLELDQDTNDDLSFHAAETLLKIDPLNAGVVADCLAAEAEDVVIDTFRYHDHTAIVVPTRELKKRFRDVARLEQRLAYARGKTCVIVARDALRLNVSVAMGSRVRRAAGAGSAGRGSTRRPKERSSS